MQLSCDLFSYLRVGDGLADQAEPCGCELARLIDEFRAFNQKWVLALKYFEVQETLDQQDDADLQEQQFREAQQQMQCPVKGGNKIDEHTYDDSVEGRPGSFRRTFLVQRLGKCFADQRE